MADLRRVELRIDVGPQASVEALAGLMTDIDSVTQFASAVQALADRETALRRILRRQYGDPENWIFLSRGILGNPGLPERYGFGEIDWETNGGVRVERLTYANPFGITINFNGDVIVRVLEIIRDWGTHRQIERARATDYEDKVQFRREVRARILRQLAENESLPPDLVSAALTPRVLESITGLAEAGLELTELDADDIGEK